MYFEMPQFRRKVAIEVQYTNYDIKKFLEKHTNFKFESAKGKVEDTLIDQNGCIQTLPQRHQMDGAFAAKLVRIE